MKIKKIPLLLSMCLISITVLAQKDSIYFKNGKNRVGDFEISIEKDNLFDTNNKNINFNLSDISKVVVNNKYWFSVDFYSNGMTKPFLAELVYQNEVSLLELSTKQGDFLIEKYFFLKNGKITAINDKNLSVFYQVYFGNKFDKTQNMASLKYNYNSILEVLNNCLGVNKNLKISSKRKTIKSKYLGIHTSWINQTYKPNFMLFDNDKLFSTPLKSKSFNWGISNQLEFNHNIILNTQLSFQKLNLNILNDSIIIYGGLSNNKYVTKIYRGDFIKSSLTLNTSLGRKFSITKNLFFDIAFGLDINHTLKEKDFSTLKTTYINNNETGEGVTIRILNFNSVNDTKLRFGISGFSQIRYQMSNSPFGVGLFVNYSKGNQHADYYDTWRGKINSHYYNIGITLYKKM